MKKVLFTATVDSHILQFHLPFLKMFKDNGYEVHVATNGNDKIPYCDVKHIVPFERNPIKLNNLKAIKQLKKICNDEKFDIIHTHTPMGSVVTRLAAKSSRKKYNTRVIYTAHGFHFFKGASIKNWLLFYPVEKFLSQFTDTLILINQEDYKLAIKKFKKCHDIRYVPGVGIDKNKFDFKFEKSDEQELRESIGLDKDDFVIIYSAELSKRKRQIWLIKALTNFLKKNRKTHLLLPGKDSLNNKCQELVESLGLNEQIHFLGYRKDIPKLLKISDLAVSSANQEGLPVNIMEAMYVGLPIVASNCRGNRDLVIEQKNGFLVELDDSARFAFSVEKIFLDKKKYSLFSKQNKNDIENYSLDKIMNQMKDIYLLNSELISVVVPVYNVSQYIKRCINSILNQKYNNLEILLIDDGSTDNSGIICDNYAKMDNRIKVIHKSNGGLSDARNVGIDNSTGKYITFIDSDDYINEDYVETLYNLIVKTKADISIGVWNEVYDDSSSKNIYKTRKRNELSGDNYLMLEHMLYQKIYDTSACAKLYKIELFNGIRFPKGKLYEDLATIYKLFLKSKKISYVSASIYNYYIRKDSITKSVFKEKDMDLIEISDTLLNDLSIIDKKHELNNRLKNAAISRYLSSNFTILNKMKGENKYNEYRSICFKNIKKYKRFNIHSRLKNNVAVIIFTFYPNFFK